MIKTCSKSFSTNPLEVSAGAPSRNPPGVIALLSPGQVFLFKEIEVLLHTCRIIMINQDSYFKNNLSKTRG